jgi:hypothetical protein
VIFRRLAVRLDVRSASDAAGAEFLTVVHKPIVPSAEAESIRFEGPWTFIESTLPLWPYSSRIGFKSAEKWSSTSVYFQTLIVRSNPEDAIRVGDMNRADLMLDECPPALGDVEVAITCPDLFQTRSNPS